MAMSLDESEKVELIKKNSRKYLPFREKIVKIGPIDTEIALIWVQKEEIMEGKIYSPVSKFAEPAKKRA